MTIEEVIRELEQIRDGAQVILDSGFGQKEGEHDLVYRRRVDFANTAIEAVSKQIAKNITVKSEMYHLDSYYCTCCSKQQKDTRKNKLNGCYCERCGNKLVWGKQ